MSSFGSYNFGVELELIAEPKRVRHPLLRAVYYEELATSLRYDGAEAEADKLNQRYRKRPEHYDKWWITKDGSLGDPEHPCIPLEAVSPILSTDYTWENQVDVFWNSWDRIFHMPESSIACGSHIHVSPSPEMEFDLNQLRNIAFGIVYYEPLVIRLLPYHRQNNKYCRPNTLRSGPLYDLMSSFHEEAALRELWDALDDGVDEEDIRDLMQSGPEPKQERYVLWNFDNIFGGGSGSIEFRGGPGLRGPVKTKRWISFVVSFIHMCTNLDVASWSHYTRPSMDRFWRDLRRSAQAVSVKENLPSDWRVMAGLVSGNSYEESVLDDFSDSGYGDDSSIMGKSDSEYSDSEYSDGEYEALQQELIREREHRCTIL
ncbi:hypothetical protein BFJ66_g2115 [Fusarium oxysporum f. sp. cepae]|uniref:Amidoligase enzyme n=1 Tax=Fusarium oxysporum f. sp. cepae TaxID=396571 RepID=A0A3L6N2X7_FUSOX|nr:hypothetical protein BFJ65_g13675 [Fusarium oxysporum f. sp. cepae]RKK43725.1 hypothetical protein BFJ67_g9474 [Fusarium oxysporum f. sp. cepae]RKK59874.1 hypothetical protein BFJ66_g2115 [Fusarium oxysporum f. sp. cepae]